MYASMAKLKMRNGACLALQLDFSSGVAQIVKCTPMFGTGFDDGSKHAEKDDDDEHDDEDKLKHAADKLKIDNKEKK